MKTLKFKTNIKCGGCIATVTPFLNKVPEISSWTVDTATPEKILTVEAGEGLQDEAVVSTLEKAGFTATPI